jgi:hypothetical protein
MIVDDVPVGIYQYDSNTGRSIAEIYPEYKGRGLGKILVLHAIYTAAKLGLDFVEDESRTSEYDNVLDSLSGNGYIVDDDGYWYVTGDGEQWLKQSLKKGIIEASGYIPRQKTDPTYSVNESSKTNSIDKRAQDLFDEYRNFIDSMEFDYGDVPLYEDFEQLNDTWRNYQQKILKWCWNSGGTGGVVSPAPIIKNLKENIWKVSNSLMENSNPQRLIKLLDTAFGKSERIKSGAIVDIIEIVSPTDGVVQIKTYENIKVANVKRDGNEVVIIDTDGNFYRTGQYLGRKIELRIIAKPGTAEKGLTLLRLYVEHDRDGNKTYDGWKIDFPGEGFSTRLSNKFKSIKEASGYIPSEKERNDPRFKTALTVDVHPDTMKRDAKKFGNKISRAGIPPTANPSGKV